MKKDELLTLISKVHNLKANPSNTLPDNSFFLDDTSVLCYPRKYGDSRYPYCCDGMTLFAHTSGYIDCVEGLFDIFQCQNTFGDTPTAFFAGEKRGDVFFPISVTGAARQLFEGEDVKRYTVFTTVCVYYVTETANAVYAVRINVDKNKKMHFSFGALNTGEKREIYLFTYFDPLLKFGDSGNNPYGNMSKFSEHLENGNYIISAKNSNMNYLGINLSVNGKVTKRHFTTSKQTVLGIKGGNLTNANAAKFGCFDKEIVKTNTNDAPCASDIIHFDFEKDAYILLDYEMKTFENKDELNNFVYSEIDSVITDKEIINGFKTDKKIFDNLNINFKNWYNDTTNPEVMNKFLKFVMRQVSFCALGENYAGPFLGIRDVFQQLESALIWQPDEARKQIVRVMNYILISGRAPRQISFATSENPIPKMDLRPFIDQGFWIIAAIHTYLAYTDDKSILDEICGYYDVEKTMGPVIKNETKDSILDHLVRITDFLVSKIDSDTNCIRMLYGDWNDAIDALGKTSDKNKEYGNGVSVMATEQLYLALNNMCEILKYCNAYKDKADKYKRIAEEVALGFRKYAVAEKDEEKRVMHGWGEDREYYVGSFNDYDGENRISLAANAYFAISGLASRFPEIKENISETILKLDNKYGLMTFNKAFYPFSEKIGRISKITPGTYENAATYVHAATFGMMALFIMGHSKEAWDILEKTVVINHKNATKTTFIMPNSYCFTPEYSIDGDSMSDWHTGSGTVIIKCLVKYGFGIQPTLDGIKIAPPEFMPSTDASISVNVKGKKLNLTYKKESGKRCIFINGKKAESGIDTLTNMPYVMISNDELSQTTNILITD